MSKDTNLDRKPTASILKDNKKVTAEQIKKNCGIEMVGGKAVLKMPKCFPKKIYPKPGTSSNVDSKSKVAFPDSNADLKKQDFQKKSE